PSPELKQIRYVTVPTEPVAPPKVIERQAPPTLLIPSKSRAGMPAPRSVAPSPNKSLQRAISDATMDPDDGKYEDGRQVYRFAEGRFYKVFARPERIVDVQLQPGEQITDIVAGDTFQWMFKFSASGLDAEQRTHFFIKPTADKISTNLVLTTTKRAYHLELSSDEATTPHNAVAWTYPSDEVAAFNSEIAKLYTPGRVHTGQPSERPRTGNYTVSGAPGGAPEDALASLNFNWAIEGDSGQHWLPTEVYDDGNRVVLRFDATMQRRQMPVLSLLTPDNRVEIVNYIQQGTTIIIPYLFDRAVLYISQHPENRVFITRTGLWTKGDRG
ncbi:MAG: TrbG/VirB9 family P-type conjugative transfer protein, partial [Roseibium sp.]